MQPGIRGQAAADLHKVILADLQDSVVGSPPVFPRLQPRLPTGPLPDSHTLRQVGGSVLSTPTEIPLAQGVDVGALTQSTLGVGELYLGLG